jgi:hypothetical protein
MPNNEYRPAPELVRLHEQLAALLRNAAQHTQAGNRLQTEQVVGEWMLPMFEGLLALFALVQGDLAMYAQSLAGNLRHEVLAGLPSDLVEELTEELSQVDEVLAGIEGLDPKKFKRLSDLQHRFGQLQKAAIEARGQLAAVIEAIEDTELPDESDVLVDDGSEDQVQEFDDDGVSVIDAPLIAEG